MGKDSATGRYPDDYDALRREVETLRARVADLQRAAARHKDEPHDGETSLPEREELLREAERIAHLGTWTWEPDSGRVTWSDEMYRILGLDPTRVKPSVDAFYAAVHPQDLPQLLEAQKDSLPQGVLPLVDLRVIRPDGSTRHTSVTSTILFDEAGVPRRIVGGVLDRTDALATEAKLRRALALLEEAQRFAQLGSWRYDPVSGELEWSAGFRRIVGLPPDAEPSLELLVEHVVPEDRERVQARLEQAAGAGALNADHYEVRLRRPDGEERHVRIESFVVRTDDGHDELRGTLLDVTDDVRMRQELGQAHKMEAIGRLAGGIAHDFNNLLMVVSANIQLLERSLGPRRELVDSRRALDSAAGLTRRLLTFGRRAQLTLEHVSPNELVTATARMMRRLVGDQVRVEVALADGLPIVRVDQVEIERALVNLVINARDVMPRGGTVRVRTSATELDGRAAVAISVEDEGHGISAADLPNVFEPFFTTRDGAGGTGLGLATVLGTAEQHGGTVLVDSERGRGSVFTVVLPAADEPAGAAQAPADAPAPAQGTEGHARRILVVDDEPEVAYATARLLEVCGHEVRMATRPEEALQIWREEGSVLDLVVCDIAMGETRGPELIARMAEQGPRPRALFITGYSEEAIRATLEHPVIAKPFSMATLQAAVARALGDDDAHARARY